MRNVVVRKSSLHGLDGNDDLKGMTLQLNYTSKSRAYNFKSEA
jgi:hypothetical protein